jgi:hypothetical protein
MMKKLDGRSIISLLEQELAESKRQNFLTAIMRLDGSISSASAKSAKMG